MKKTLRTLVSLFCCAALAVGVVLPLPAAGAEMRVAATAALLVDAHHGDILYDQDAHARRYPASITKIMTALLVLEAIDRGELAAHQVLTASDAAWTGLVADGSTQNIRPGQSMTVENLLYCTLVASANEACNILALGLFPTAEEFVAAMNRRAGELGMDATHFVNTHGLHHADHYTTAYDIYLLTMAAMEHPLFCTIVSTAEWRIDATDTTPARHFYNTNALLSQWRYLGYVYDKAIGIKTGSTPEAGHCLVSAAVEEDGRMLVAVVLGAENPVDADGTVRRLNFSESSRLLEWGFDSFTRKTLIDPTLPLAEVTVTLSQETGSVALRPAGVLEATLPTDLDPAQFTRTVTLTNHTVAAPVAKGQVLGTVALTYEGKHYGTLDLVAVDSVARSDLLYRMDQVTTFFGQTWVKVALAALAVLLVALILRIAVFGGRRRYSSPPRYRRRRR